MTVAVPRDAVLDSGHPTGPARKRKRPGSPLITIAAIQWNSPDMNIKQNASMTLPIGCTVLLTTTVLLSGCRPAVRNADTDAAPIPIRVRTPTLVERPDYVSASGSVEAARSVDAAFEIGGKIARVCVEEGQAVHKGQLLAELDGADYGHALEAASAQVDAARAGLRKADAGPRPQELEQARLEFDRWQDEYNRMRFLYERKSLPPNDYKKVEAAYRASSERYEMARQGTRSEDKAAAEAQFRAASAQASEARKRLDDTRLAALSPASWACVAWSRDRRCGGNARGLGARPQSREGSCGHPRGRDR